MTTKGMLIQNFALNIYWRPSKQNTTQRLLIRNFALVYIGDLISIPCTKSYLSTKGCTLNWSLNATYKILSVHQRMYSKLSLNQGQFPKKTTFSFTIIICPLKEITNKTLSVHQRMHSNLSLKQKQFPKKTAVSFKNCHWSTKRDNTQVKCTTPP